MEGAGHEAKSLYSGPLAVSAAFIFLPIASFGALEFDGNGPVIRRVAAFLSSPEDIVPVVALAMFAGLRGTEYGRRVLLILPASWFVGCLLGGFVRRPLSWPVAAISFLLFGGLVAANAQFVIARPDVTLGISRPGAGWHERSRGAVDWIGVSGLRGPGWRNIYFARTSLGIGGLVAAAVGQNRSACRRKLDCGHRIIVARLGSPTRIA